MSQNTISSIMGGTASQLAATVFSSTVGAANYMPSDVLIIETDTGKIKVSQLGVQYNDLPYTVDTRLTAAQVGILNNRNTANNSLVLSADGMIASAFIPDEIGSEPIIVSDITNREAIPLNQRNGLIVVLDASDDSSVTSSSSVLPGGTLSALAHYDNTVADSSDFHATAVVRGASGLSTAQFSTTNKMFGISSIYFDKSYAVSYRMSNPILANADYTVEVFVNITSASATDQEILVASYVSGDGTTITDQLVLMIEGGTGKLKLIGSNPAVTLSTTSAIAVGSWHHIAVVHEGGTIALRQNGQLIDSVSHISTGIINDVSLGQRYNADGFISTLTKGMIGYVDELRVINGYAAYTGATSTVPVQALPARKAVATYIWNTTDNVWVKVSEAESMDVDFSDFVKQGNAIDRLVSGSTYVQFTPTERNSLSQMITTLGTLTSSWTSKVNEATGAFDVIEGRQTVIEGRLSSAEDTASDLNAHVLLDTDTVEFGGYTVSRWNA